MKLINIKTTPLLIYCLCLCSCLFNFAFAALAQNDELHILTRSEISKKIENQKKSSIVETKKECSQNKFYIWKNYSAAAKLRSYALRNIGKISQKLEEKINEQYENRYFKKFKNFPLKSKIYGPGLYLSDSIEGASLQRQIELNDREQIEIDKIMESRAIKLLTNIYKQREKLLKEKIISAKNLKQIETTFNKFNSQKESSAISSLYDLYELQKAKEFNLIDAIINTISSQDKKRIISDLNSTNSIKIIQLLSLLDKKSISDVKNKVALMKQNQRLYQISFDKVECVDMGNDNFDQIKKNLRKNYLPTTITKNEIVSTKKIPLLFKYNVPLKNKNTMLNYFIFRDNIPHHFNLVDNSNSNSNSNSNKDCVNFSNN
ncbi:MAG: hypothetical protein HQK49_17895 [Oligoflexia bacterium]|nr:hypothetical protein [Oligoflexia bacterium]